MRLFIIASASLVLFLIIGIHFIFKLHKVKLKHRSKDMDKKLKEDHLLSEDTVDGNKHFVYKNTLNSNLKVDQYTISQNRKESYLNCVFIEPLDKNKGIEVREFSRGQQLLRSQFVVDSQSLHRHDYFQLLRNTKYVNIIIHDTSDFLNDLKETPLEKLKDFKHLALEESAAMILFLMSFIYFGFRILFQLLNNNLFYALSLDIYTKWITIIVFSSILNYIFLINWYVIKNRLDGEK